VGNCEANRMSDRMVVIRDATVSGNLGSAGGLTGPWTVQSVNTNYCEANPMSDRMVVIGDATVSGNLDSAGGLTGPWTVQSVNTNFDNSAKFLLRFRSKSGGGNVYYIR
jgi:hypothetical protein